MGQIKSNSGEAVTAKSPSTSRKYALGALVTAAALVFGLAAPAWGYSQQRPATEQTPVNDAGDEETLPPENETPESDSNFPVETPAPEESENSDPEGDDSEVTDEGLQGDEESSSADLEAEEDAIPVELKATSIADAKILAASPAGVLNDTRNGRISGSDRFTTAVAISKHAYTSAETVVIATGMDFPDSLSAAPFAAKLRAPLLLTLRGSLPAATRAEIQRLKPTNIIIVGGTGAVSSGVQNSLKGLAKNVERLSGSDRYGTSVAISKRGWGAELPSSVFVATGTGYADALSAGAAAGKLSIPVILVPGSSSTAPSNVRNELKRLNPSRLYIAGGTGVVSSNMQRSVAENGAAVTRFPGSDRFDTSARIANGIFGSTATRSTYLAYGLGFADALTGAAVAGAAGSPLLLAMHNCIPSSVYAASDRRKPNRSYLLGGAGVLNSAVLHGNECLIRPPKVSNATWAGTQKLYSRINADRYNANLSGARATDSSKGTIAHTWANRKRVQFNDKLKTSQKWIRYEGVVRSRSGGDRVKAIHNLVKKDSTAKKWLNRKTAGARTFVSVGYVASSPYSYATIYVGTNP